jgi:hypothetical protein
VVGVEREPRFAEMARREIERRHLTNVAIIEDDALGRTHQPASTRKWSSSHRACGSSASA